MVGVVAATEGLAEIIAPARVGAEGVHAGVAGRSEGSDGILHLRELGGAGGGLRVRGRRDFVFCEFEGRFLTTGCLLQLTTPTLLLNGEQRGSGL